MSASKSKVYSMTGFASIEGVVGTQRLRIEIKGVNHRFLDVKVRLPRELSAAEMPFRAAIQTKLQRGAVEVKVERIADPAAPEVTIAANLALARAYHAALISIQKTLGLTDTIRTVDVAGFSEVIGRTAGESTSEEAWGQLQPLAAQALEQFAGMRRHEGQALETVLREALNDMGSKIAFLRDRRAECADQYRAKMREKIQGVFDAYPISTASVQATLESRISQELALLLDRTDIEEELVRFKGHLGHFRKVMDTGGPVGRKLDFILQELSREINTLGNKAQDLPVSEEVVQLKVRLEQLREQVMNLE